MTYEIINKNRIDILKYYIINFIKKTKQILLI